MVHSLSVSSNPSICKDKHGYLDHPLIPLEITTNSSDRDSLEKIEEIMDLGTGETRLRYVFLPDDSPRSTKFGIPFGENSPAHDVLTVDFSILKLLTSTAEKTDEESIHKILLNP